MTATVTAVRRPPRRARRRHADSIQALDVFAGFGDQCAGFGNAVVPAQGRWVVEQLTPCIRGAA